MVRTPRSAAQEQAERQARFSEVYERHYDRLLRYAWRRVGPDRAEDLVHETFTVVWRRLDEMPPDETAWLYKVAHNLLLNSNRALQRDARIISSALPVWEPDHAEAVSERQAAFAALAKLSASDRYLVQLVAWEGFNASQISDLLGCSRASTYLRLHRLRQRLERLLDSPN